MNKELKIFILLVSLFLLFYFMPIESFVFGGFMGAVFSGLTLLKEYSREHILTCLLPAFFIAGAIAVFISKEAILKYLGAKTKKTISYSLASVSGAILAVCSCTILPLFAGIRKRGAGLGPAITFLFAGPAINLAAVFLTISVLGLNIGLARIIAAILLAILVGLSMQLIFREKNENNDLFIEASKQSVYNKKTIFLFMLAMVGILIVNGLAINQILKYILSSGLTLTVIFIALSKFEKTSNYAWLRETWNLAKILLPLLFIGVFIAGLIAPFLSQELIEKIVGSNSLSNNLIASMFGALMYFSTLTEVPILQTLIAKGMNQGPALALLLAGPSLSLPNMLIIRKVLGNQKTATYILLVIFYSSLAGLIFGQII